VRRKVSNYPRRRQGIPSLPPIDFRATIRIIK
jgi:hypothetical protein